MADGSVTIDTKLNNDGFEKGLSGIQSKLNKFSGIANTAFNGVKTAVAGTAKAIGIVSTAIGGVAVAGAKYNAGIEQYQTSFEVMTGSAEKATETVENLKKLGAETPFEMTDLAETTQLLMNYGLNADDAQSKLKMLGDISQGSADKMNRIAMAYGQMSSAGKVSLEDVKQMIEAGFNPLQEISQSTGESMSSLYDRISKGTISVDEITASMERSTSAGGKYFQSMQKQSQTVSGQISTLKDNVSQLMGGLAKGFSQSLGGTILPLLNETASGLQEAFNTGGIEGFTKAIGPVLANLITKMSEQLPNIINLGVNIIQSLISGIQQNLHQILQGATLIINSLIQGIVTILPQLLPVALQILQTLIMVFLENLPLLINMGVQLLFQLIIGISQMLPSLIPVALDCILTLAQGCIDNIGLIIDAGIELLLGLALGLVDAIPLLIEKIPVIITSLVKKLTEPAMLSKIIQGAITLIGALIKGLIQSIPAILGAIPQIISSIANDFKDFDWWELGRNLLQGILNGFSNVGNLVWDAIKRVGSSMIDGIKSFFGIHSPSKVMADLGKYLPQGFAIGIEADGDKATKSIKKMNDNILSSFDLSSIYSKMQTAVALETGKIATNLSTTANIGKVLTANINVTGDTYMDSTKVGRMIAPSITKTLRGGGVH